MEKKIKTIKDYNFIPTVISFASSVNLESYPFGRSRGNIEFFEDFDYLQNFCDDQILSIEIDSQTDREIINFRGYNLANNNHLRYKSFKGPQTLGLFRNKDLFSGLVTLILNLSKPNYNPRSISIQICLTLLETTPKRFKYGKR